MAEGEGLDNFLSGFEFDDAEPGGGAPEPIGQRHEREARELKEQIRALKASAKKSERPAVLEQVGKLEAEQSGRHARELAEEGLSGLSISGARPKKGSKARERKQREEAEREARLAEGRKNAGPAKGALESEALGAQLAPLGLRVHEVAADGHCLFRSVAYQLAGAEGQPADAAVWALREKAAAQIRAHAADYLPFFEPTESAPSLEAYCSEMASTAAWGGQLELRALAQALGRSLRVHQAGAPPVVMNGGAQGSPVELSFHQHAYGLGEHYNAVRPEPPS